ncbi:MAG: hypothetical protein HFG26_07730 [Provencibacterium sp.]|jgi:hypothetical protein|nr:hypothetical protein [Provencibacterium sp.]
MQFTQKIRRTAAALLCGLLFSTAAVAAEMPVDGREEAYLVQLQKLKLEERYQNGRITLEEYFEQKEPLDVQEEEYGRPFALVCSPEDLPKRYDTQYNDVQYQKRINREKREALESLYQNQELASPAYYSRRLSLERRADDLEREEERILWESLENPDGRGGDIQNQLWEIRYDQYCNEWEGKLLEALYRTGRIDKERFTDRRDELRKEAEKLAAREKKANREEEKYRLRTVIPEESYNGYLEAKGRLAEIEKELDKLAGQLEAGELGSLSYWDQKAALEEEQNRLHERIRTEFSGYADDSRTQN